MDIQPKHGQERSNHVEQSKSSFDGVTGGGEAVSFEYVSSECSVAEKYCAHCKEWISTKPLGLIGFCICPQCKEMW